MKRNSVKEFTRPDGTIVICATDAAGRRLPTRYVKAGSNATPSSTASGPRRVDPERLKQLREGRATPEPKRTRPARQPAPPPTVRTDCVHILGATGDSVEQKNCGCPGNKMTSVWECELFGRVAPFAKGDPVDGVRACQKCGRYEKALPPASPAE